MEDIISDVNINALRKDLIDYLGSAYYFNPVSQVYLIKVEMANAEELIKIAISLNVDLDNYKLKYEL